MNRQHVTLRVIFYLSAAFDTVDHHIMLEQLKSGFGIQDQVLKWFTSYLSNRSQFISVNGGTSKRFDLKNGVPQGSCLVPLLFVLYVSKLFQILESHLPDAHAFADDNQLYVSFQPDSMSE
jgi:retron-type reverse transcriptase